MEEEVGTEVKLHLPRHTLDGIPLDETQDTASERDPKDEQSEKEYPSLGNRKDFAYIGRIVIAAPREL